MGAFKRKVVDCIITREAAACAGAAGTRSPDRPGAATWVARPDCNVNRLCARLQKVPKG